MMQAIFIRATAERQPRVQAHQNFVGALLLTAIACCGLAHASGDLSCTIVGASEVAADGSLNPLAGKKNYYENV